MSEEKSGPTEPNSDHDQVLHIPAQAAHVTDSIKISATTRAFIPTLNFSRWPQCSAKTEKLWAGTEAGAWAHGPDGQYAQRIWVGRVERGQGTSQTVSSLGILVGQEQQWWESQGGVDHMGKELRGDMKLGPGRDWMRSWGQDGSVRTPARFSACGIGMICVLFANWFSVNGDENQEGCEQEAHLK